jgi:death-on-curing protein
LHPTIASQAVAYLFHISRNHPFLDGNKRTALAVADTFLLVNGYSLVLSDEALYDLVQNVAQGLMDKDTATGLIADNLVEE